jgi:hypothetical protein
MAIGFRRRVSRGAGLLVVIVLLICGALLLKRTLPHVWAPSTDDAFSRSSLSGRVVDTHGHGLPDARVRIKGRSSLVMTDGDGRFRLPLEAGLDEISEATVTAAKPGYLIGSAPAGSQPVVIELKLLPDEDCTDYRWVDPRPDPAAEHNCGNCHEAIYAEWRGGAHARSATGRKFMNLYAGTDWHGRPGRGWSLLDEHASGATVCTACHAPTIDFGDPAYDDLRLARGTAAQGVHCDYCHKLHDVRDDKLGLTHGRFAQRLLRPRTGQLFFGPLDDVDRGEDAYSPLQRDSRLCAACHEGIVFGVHVYSTYSEWLASPARAAGKQCQDCHMAPTGRMTNVAPGAGGIERDPLTLSGHDFLPGGKEAMLRRSVKVEFAVSKLADGWRVEVEVVARNVGHRVPTGFIDRHLLLVVDPQDDRGAAMPAISGPVLPAASGSFTGRRGRMFAKLLADLDGQGPIPFWRPAADPIDTRLVPEQPVRSQFVVPATARRVRVRLIYRPFWESVARDKAWPADEIVVYDETREIREGVRG